MKQIKLVKYGSLLLITALQMSCGSGSSDNGVHKQLNSIKISEEAAISKEVPKIVPPKVVDYQLNGNSAGSGNADENNYAVESLIFVGLIQNASNTMGYIQLPDKQLLSVKLGDHVGKYLVKSINNNYIELEEKILQGGAVSTKVYKLNLKG